jgi:excisionase family DNA binding protein
MDKTEFIKSGEAARILGVSRYLLMRAIESGGLVNYGANQILLKRSDVLEYAEKRENAAFVEREKIRARLARLDL